MNEEMKGNKKAVKYVLMMAGVLAVILVIILVLKYFYFNRENRWLNGYRHQSVLIGDSKIDAWVADSEAKQKRGLAGVKNLNDDQGMLFIFSQPGDYAFWMKGMNIPIDIIWVSDNEVVSLSSDVQLEPGVDEALLKQYHPGKNVDSVLEVNASWISSHQIRVGDRIIVR